MGANLSGRKGYATCHFATKVSGRDHGAIHDATMTTRQRQKVFTISMCLQRWLCPVFLCGLLLLPPAADAQERPPAYREAQLAAVAQLRIGPEITIRGCSAVLITPIHALTAAHCTRPQQRHFLTFRPGTAAAAVAVAQVVRHPGHIAEAQIPGQARYMTDLALLTLSAPVPGNVATPMALTQADPAQDHALYGYPNSPGRPLMGDDACMIGTADAPVIVSTCAAVGGQSGGALVVDRADGPHLVGIAVARINDPGTDIRSLALQPDPATFPALADALQNAPTPSLTDQP